MAALKRDWDMTSETHLGQGPHRDWTGAQMDNFQEVERPPGANSEPGARPKAGKPGPSMNFYDATAVESAKPWPRPQATACLSRQAKHLYPA